MLHLASSCEVFTDDHLEEVEGRVQTVLVELQLTAELLDLTLPWRHTRLISSLCFSEVTNVKDIHV